jgi:hypothetical protein
MARDPEKSAHVAHVLYAQTIAGDIDLKQIAARTGIHYRTIHSWAHNEASFPAWAIPVVCGVVDDMDKRSRFFEALSGARELGLVMGQRQIPGPSPESVLLHALGLTGDVGRLAELVGRVWSDGRVTSQECAELEQLVDQVQRSAETLRQQARTSALTTGRNPAPQA